MNWITIPGAFNFGQVTGLVLAFKLKILTSGTTVSQDW